MCLPLFPCTIKSRSFLLALAHPGGPGKRAIKWLWWWCLNMVNNSKNDNDDGDDNNGSNVSLAVQYI